MADLGPFKCVGPAALVTGTLTAAVTEADIVSGGKTLIITLTGATWVAAGAAFDAIRQDIINGLDSAQAEATGWDALVVPALAVTDVVRTSDTVVTITLPAVASYDITADETITATVPASATSATSAIGALPTVTISSLVAVATITGTITSSVTETDIIAGGDTLIITLSNATWVAAGAAFDAIRQDIINGLDSAQAEPTGWDALVVPALSVTDVVRTSDTVVTITLPAVASYDITADETITVTVPASATSLASAIVATPAVTITTVVGCIFASMTTVSADGLSYDLDADPDWNDDAPRPLRIRPDGTRLYAHREPFGGSICELVQYDMATAFDVSGMTKSGVFDLTSEYPVGVSPSLSIFHFAPDGLTLFTWDNNGGALHVYSLATAWDITTATLFYSTDWDNFFAFTSQSMSFKGFAIDAAGTSAIIHDSANQVMYNISLSTPWDLRTLTIDLTRDVSGITQLGVATYFQCDGSMACDVEASGDTLHIFNMTTPFDVSTIAFDRTITYTQSVFLRSLFEYDVGGNRMIAYGSDSRFAPAGRTLESFTFS